VIATVDIASLKQAAAMRAVTEVQDGMVVGLGTGSTATFAVEALARRVAQGLRIVTVPTSERTRELAQKLGVPLAPAGDWPSIDLVIDGADQVERGSLDLIKGLGGALLREKIVASSGRRMIVVVDESKIVDRLGGRTPLPVEIVAFGWQGTLERLAALGVQPRLRLMDDRPFVSDGGVRIGKVIVPVVPLPPPESPPPVEGVGCAATSRVTVAGTDVSRPSFAA